MSPLSEKQLEEGLAAAGESLVHLPSSLDELLPLLDGSEMAPGELRNLKKKYIPNLSQQALKDIKFKPTLIDSLIVRSIRGDLEKENASSGGAKTTVESRAPAIAETPQDSTKGSQSKATNQNSKAGQPSITLQNPTRRHRAITTQNSDGSPHTTVNQTSKNKNTPQDTIVQAPQSPRQTREISEDPSTVSPQDESFEPASDTTAIGSKKRGRGQTMGKGIMKYYAASGNKMKINVDPSIGRPINVEESAKLASQIGVVARDVILVPTRWKEVDETNGLKPGFDHLQIHMDINVDAPGVRECLIERLKYSSRQKRHKLHKHFQKFATLEEAKDNKPSSVPTKEHWGVLCDFFASAKYKHISDVNKGNRKNLRCKHISGRKAFTVRRHEITQKELNGELCDRIELYKRTHCTETGKWSSVEAEENWDLMVEKREQYINEGIEKTDDEIVLEVLGHGSGYIKGLGYGPKPPTRRNTSIDSTSQQLQKELQETQEKLQQSETQVNKLETQVNGFENEVTVLKDQLSQNSATVNKLMAYLASTGVEL